MKIRYVTIPFIPLICALVGPRPKAMADTQDTVSVDVKVVAPMTVGVAREEIVAGRYDNAVKILDDILKKEPKSFDELTVLGDAYWGLGSIGKAMKNYKRALTINPHHAPAFAGKGKVFEKQGKQDEAINEYRAALAADPKNEEARLALDRLIPPSTPTQETPFP